MINKKIIVFLFFVSFSISAQIKGIVVDQYNNPIAYVNVSVENENIGTSTEENGQFVINVNDKNKNLVFSALGFEQKTIKATEAEIVKLNAVTYELNEVVLSNKKETKKIEIGQTENQIYQAFDNGPRMDAKYFQYNPSYKKTRFIKQVSVYTDSKIEEASIKIHFYDVDSTGFPGKELLDKNFIVSVKKGQRRTIFNVSDFNLSIAKKGIFVGVERLIIEKNKFQKTTTDLISKTTKTQNTYFPIILCAYVERPFLWTFYGGKWNKLRSKTPNTKVFEPAINLILTN
ncbi:carboxypeptidase-like regulatory domain-containing protein [Flavobacterium sp.]|uniref:carboxypeptidase-like regulatory domain-containing protein n=1 Tax=Flavobacterium sp. TaxID=239 RepID=UPI00286E6264|nr:carboxypeptidase-like regulatory domain-containing protein [Flavobacterium sp.]